MAHTFEELRTMNVTQLREIAKEVDHDAVQGHSTMHKEHLVEALCKAYGIPARVHHDVVGINKTAVRARIKAMKAKRDAALATGDSKQLKFARRRIHELKRAIHRATV